MSQARHAMGGPNRVSSLQYDSVMSSLVNVQFNECSPSDADADKPSLDRRGKEAEFHLEWRSPGATASEPSKAAAEEEVTVRRRKKEGGIEELVNLEDSGDNGDSVEGGNRTAKDPLLWFGVLVPPALRRSQQFFKQGELLIENVYILARHLL